MDAAAQPGLRKTLLCEGEPHFWLQHTKPPQHPHGCAVIRASSAQPFGIHGAAELHVICGHIAQDGAVAAVRATTLLDVFVALCDFHGGFQIGSDVGCLILWRVAQVHHAGLWVPFRWLCLDWKLGIFAVWLRVQHQSMEEGLCFLAGNGCRNLCLQANLVHVLQKVQRVAVNGASAMVFL